MAADSGDLCADDTLPPLFAIRLEDLRDWHVVIVRCYRCNREGEVWPARLKRGRQPYERLLHVARLLKCSECGNRENNSVRVRKLPR